jgi:hypothetical protein
MGFIHLGLAKSEIMKGDDNALKWKGEKDLHIYEKYFEDKFILESKEYYIMKSKGWLQNLNCPEYLKEAKEYLESEESRADRYFDAQTKPKLLDVA